MLWHKEAMGEISARLSSMPGIVSFAWKGSCLEPESMDSFSDLDLDITLSGPVHDAKSWMSRLFGGIAVFAYEQLGGADKTVLRICLENGWRLDLTCRPGFQNNPPDEPGTLAWLSNHFWFTAIMASVKLGRRDNLIAAHLALDLYRDILVLLMLERDRRSGTNIHRFGEDEDISFLLGMLPRESDTATGRELISRLIDGAVKTFSAEIRSIYPKEPDKAAIFRRILSAYCE
jgi:hypothetical protein